MNELIEKYKTLINVLKPNYYSEILKTIIPILETESIEIAIKYCKSKISLYYDIYDKYGNVVFANRKYADYEKIKCMETAAYKVIIKDLIFLDPIQHLAIIRKEQYN